MRPLVEPEIVVASHNAGKVAEINDLISPFGLVAKSATDHNLAEPAETGTTFEENAHIKAFAAMKATGLPALADDSGLCVRALDGDPGVYTADWAEKPDGSGRDFSYAMDRVEAALKEVGADDPTLRSAKFVAVLCVVWPDEHAEYFRGEVEGEIVWPPVGDKGFGYDPIFKPSGFGRTFGEMSAEEKHGWNPDSDQEGLSHRARAFAQLARNCLRKMHRK